jgi:hypothetical protein
LQLSGSLVEYLNSVKLFFMKLLFSLIVLPATALFFMAASPRATHSKKTNVSETARPKFNATIFGANGTAWNAIVTVGSPLDTLHCCGGYTLGSVANGTYTVTIRTLNPGVTYRYKFTGQTDILTSSGSATWFNVAISGSATASIFVN